MKRSTVLTILIWWVSLSGPALAVEPAAPEDNQLPESVRAANLQALGGLTPDTAFQSLENAVPLLDDQQMDQAVNEAFGKRKQKGVDVGIRHLRYPSREKIDDQWVSHEDDFQASKHIVQNFPDESFPELMKLYKTGDPIAKRNVIRVTGNMKGRQPQAVENLLISALDDQGPCNEGTGEEFGDPIRICDEAYNQLILRFQITDLPRVLGSAHSLADRDNCINRLKQML